jgi:hypothetical protein
MPIAAKAGSAPPEFCSAVKFNVSLSSCKLFSSYNAGEKGRRQRMGDAIAATKTRHEGGFLYSDPEARPYVSRMILSEKSATFCFADLRFGIMLYMPRPS